MLDIVDPRKRVPCAPPQVSVETDSGATIEVNEDFRVDGDLGNLLVRYYSSSARQVGPLGRGTRTPLDVTLQRPPTGEVLYYGHKGQIVSFACPAPLPGVWTGNRFYKNLALAAGAKKSFILRDEGIYHTFEKFPDAIWRLTGLRDRNDNAVAITRDGGGIVETISFPNGLKLTFDNDAQGLRKAVSLVSVDGQSRKIVDYGYDDRKNLVSVDLSYGRHRQYTYDEDNRRSGWRDGADWGRHAFDRHGRTIKIETWGPHDNDRYEYDHVNKRTVLRSGCASEQPRVIVHDDDGRKVAVIDEAGNEIDRIEYNADGQKVLERDAAGRRTQFQYSNGFLRSKTDPAGRREVSYRNHYGDVEYQSDALGQLWRYGRDERGNLVSIQDPVGYRTDVTNDAQGRRTGTMRHDGLIENRSYDGWGRLIAIRDFRGGTTSYDYDGFGRVVSSRDPLGATTRFEYDEPGQDFWTPRLIRHPEGNAEERRFDRETNETTLVDAEGRRLAFRLDSSGQLQELRDGKNGRLKYGYDGMRRLVRVENQNGRSWTFTRDGFGRVVREIDFDNRRFDYTYDLSGRLVERLADDGTSTLYRWDEGGLLIEVTASTSRAAGQSTIRFRRDAVGNVIWAANDDAVVAFERDALGRITAETIDGRRVESTYDCCGNRTARRIGEHVVESDYDPLGTLKRLSIDDREPLHFAYDVAGRELRRTSGHGFACEQRHDARGRLCGQVAGSRATGIDVVRRDYAWNGAGEPTHISDARWGQTAYVYDDNGQVIEGRHGDGAVERFAYDAAQNVVAVASGSATLAGHPDLQANRPVRHTPGGGVTEAHGPNGERVFHRHDEAGRVIERRVERDGFRPALWRYQWNVWGMLAACETPTGERWAYGYDAFGRRLWKRPAAAQAAGTFAPDRDRPGRPGTAYGWDGDLMVEQAPLASGATPDWANATRWHYAPHSFRPLAREDADGELLYVVTDHLGTPREMLDETGRLRWAVAYHVWGAVRRQRLSEEDEAPDADRELAARSPTQASGRAAEAFELCPVRFPGQWADEETGLCYNRFRHYDASAGQYVSPDPLKAWGALRPYGYVAGPTVRIDPLGLSCCGPGDVQDADWKTCTYLLLCLFGHDPQTGAYKPKAPIVIEQPAPVPRPSSGQGKP